MNKHVVTIHDLSDAEIETIFSYADSYLKDRADPNKPYRVNGRRDIARDYLLATLFYEPSTRTRFSFESAMKRLGGDVLSSADAGSTSAAKGESIADTIRVVQNYADLIVIRHPAEGAARVAADFADVPVINAGDGGHEHPTQTLCDLYTLRTELGGLDQLKEKSVLLCGDLRHGRTIHSLVYALARFGASIVPYPAPGLDLPEHVSNRLRDEFNCVRRPARRAAGHDTSMTIDFVYATPTQPHQRTLFREIPSEVYQLAEGIDICYVTRLQKERLGQQDNGGHYPVVDTSFLKGKRYQHSKVLHPLPRVSELGYDLDSDDRAVYFRQAAYGVCVRMGLIAWALGLEKANELQEDTGWKARSDYPTYDRSEGIRCTNPRCVTQQESEKRYLGPRFWIVRIDDQPLRLRCAYCEFESTPQFVGNLKSHRYTPLSQKKKDGDHDNLVYFADESQATSARFSPARRVEQHAIQPAAPR